MIRPTEFRCRRRRATCLALFGISFLLLMGCTDAPKPPPVEKKALSPKERFADFAERLKQRIGGSNDRRFVEHSSPTHETSLFHYKIEDVTYEVHEPGEASDVYTATLTVSIATSYTVLSSNIPKLNAAAVSDDPTSYEEDTEENGSDEEEDPYALKEPPRTNVYRRRHADKDTYDFVFENDRWELTTRNVEEWMKLAIEYASED